MGLMEYLWDVVYVTWACLVVVMVVGERGWWVWVSLDPGMKEDLQWANGFAQSVIPGYAAYLGLGMYKKVRGGGMGALMGGMGGMEGQEEEVQEEVGMSKRQQKMEKRGGQKVRYR